MTLERTQELKRASWIGILGNAFLASLKILVGFISGSLAVIGDGIDSLSDVLTYIITLFTTRIISKPPDCKYPYGYRKAETISTKVLSFIIFFAGAQLLISTGSRLISGEQREMPSIIAIYVTVLSIIGKGILAAWQFKIGKRNKSSMIIANAKNMRNDILISASVLIGLIFTFILKLPTLDLITALFVSLWIIKVAFGIFQESNMELMDGVQDIDVYNKIFKAVDEVKGAQNPHRIRVRQLANMLLIAMDIEVNKNISVEDAHEISMKVEERLRLYIPNIYDALIHIEPEGNIEENEVYGISKENLNT
ncbi:MAG: cation diffusion facilitator family transporter [Bacteroidales bacterium]|nr:cation diffusion facilitator family transporter [Bacteroidales bacterium]MCF8404722.1 cation diffusion facilitator family transporter [Bacteroidales bacterium]